MVNEKIEEVQGVNLVFSFDEGYFGPFQVLLRSIHFNNPDEKFQIYFLHQNMKNESLIELRRVIEFYGMSFHPINCIKFLQEDTDITINRYYTIEMYLWMFAPYVLPENVDRALYLDPDIINLNPLNQFYDSKFDDHLFIAMDYEVKTKIVQPFNNLRLGTKDGKHYFNSGIVLMNIDRLRKERNTEEIIEAVVKNKAILILPDQDIFNFLYVNEIKNEDWEYFNLDPRLYQFFSVLMPEKYNKKWVDNEVVFIHYCGKHKPWLEREKYKMDLGYYYFYYEDLLRQEVQGRESEFINDTTF